MLNIASITDDSIVDGPGIRLTIFMQGCNHRCDGCQNPSALEFGVGKNITVEQVTERVFANPLLSGITLSGGEPFAQAKECATLCKHIKNNNTNIQKDISNRLTNSKLPIQSNHLTIWCYTGYLLEDLQERARTDIDIQNLMQQIDVLVDGPFEKSQKDLNLIYKGSKNQRIIDLPQSLATNKVILYPIEYS